MALRYLASASTQGIAGKTRAAKGRKQGDDSYWFGSKLDTALTRPAFGFTPWLLS